MINYVILLIGVFCFTLQFALTKLYERLVKQTIFTALIMLVVSNLTGARLFFIIGGFKVEFSLVSTIFAIINALVMIPYYVVGIKVLSLGSLAIYSMFMMLGGMLVPFFYGIIFLSEELSVGKLLGTILLTVFIVLQGVKQDDKDSQKANNKTKRIFFILCLVIFILNGLTGVVSKAHQISSGIVDEMSFTVLSCLLTALLSACLIPACIKKENGNAVSFVKSILKIKPFCVMVFMGISAYMGNFLHLLAASHIPASVQFPLVSGGVIVFSAIASVTVFKEKAGKFEWISVGGAFISTLLFAF